MRNRVTHALDRIRINGPLGQTDNTGNTTHASGRKHAANGSLLPAEVIFMAAAPLDQAPHAIF